MPPESPQTIALTVEVEVVEFGSALAETTDIVPPPIVQEGPFTFGNWL